MAQQSDQAMEQEIQQARERVAELEKRRDIAKERAELQRKLDALNADEQSIGKPAQPAAPAPKP